MVLTLVNRVIYTWYHINIGSGVVVPCSRRMRMTPLLHTYATMLCTTVTSLLISTTDGRLLYSTQDNKITG